MGGRGGGGGESYKGAGGGGWEWGWHDFVVTQLLTLLARTCIENTHVGFEGSKGCVCVCACNRSACTTKLLPVGTSVDRQQSVGRDRRTTDEKHNTHPKSGGTKGVSATYLQYRAHDATRPVRCFSCTYARKCKTVLQAPCSSGTYLNNTNLRKLSEQQLCCDTQLVSLLTSSQKSAKTKRGRQADNFLNTRYCPPPPPLPRSSQGQHEAKQN